MNIKPKNEKEQAERFYHAAEVLRHIDPGELNLGGWGFSDTDCVTFACIAGHCSLNPWFREKGFSADWVLVIDDFELRVNAGSFRQMVWQFFGERCSRSYIFPRLPDSNDPELIADAADAWTLETFGYEKSEFPSLSIHQDKHYRIKLPA